MSESASSLFSSSSSSSSALSASSAAATSSSSLLASSSGLAAALLAENAVARLWAKGSYPEAKWVRSLSASVPVAPPLCTLPPWPALEDCILTPGSRLWFAADFHNKFRGKALLGTLSRSFVTLKIKKMESLMKRQAYLNVRDGESVHLLNSVAQVEESDRTFFADFDAKWETAAMRLWEPRPPKPLLPVDDAPAVDIRMYMNPPKKRKERDES